MTKTIKHFRLKIKTKTKSKMPATMNTALGHFNAGLFVFYLTAGLSLSPVNLLHNKHGLLKSTGESGSQILCTLSEK